MTTSQKPTNLLHVKPGRDPREMIERLYSEGRTRPREHSADWPKRPAQNWDATQQGKPVQRDHGSQYHRHEEIQSPQHRENFHDKHYDNDASGWVRGAPNGQAPTGNNETAEKLPNYDRGQAYRTDRDSGMRDQIKDRHSDHHKHHSEFELTGKHGTTHAMEAHNASKRHVPNYEKRGELGGDNSQPKHKKWEQG